MTGYSDGLRAATALFFGILILIFVTIAAISEFGKTQLDFIFFQMPLSWILPFVLLAALGVFVYRFLSQMGFRTSALLSFGAKGNVITQGMALKAAENDLRRRGIHIVGGSPPRSLRLTNGLGWRIIFKQTDPEGEWAVDVSGNGEVLNSSPVDELRK